MLSVNSAEAQKLSDKKFLIKKVEDYLNDKGYLADDAFKQYQNTGEPSISLNGVFHYLQKKDSIINGVYRVDIEVHAPSHLVIFDNGNVHFLDLHNRENLLQSMKTALKFFKKKNYCKEIINRYITEMLSTYNLNQRKAKGRGWGKSRCEDNQLETSSSNFPLKSFKQKLFDYLKEEEKIVKSNVPQDLNFLDVERLGLLCGLSKDNEHINEGVYSFFYYYANEPANDLGVYFVVIKKNDYSIIKMEDFESFTELFLDTISYADSKDLPLKIIEIMTENLVNNYFEKSCLSDETNKLP